MLSQHKQNLGICLFCRLFINMLNSLASEICAMHDLYIIAAWAAEPHWRLPGLDGEFIFVLDGRFIFVSFICEHLTNLTWIFLSLTDYFNEKFHRYVWSEALWKSSNAISGRYILSICLWLFPRMLAAHESWFSSRNIVLPLPPYVLFMYVSLNFPSLLAVLLQHKLEVLVHIPLNSLNLNAFKNWHCSLLPSVFWHQEQLTSKILNLFPWVLRCLISDTTLLFACFYTNKRKRH